MKKNSFSVDYHISLDFEDSLDLYIYTYLLYVADQLVDSNKSNVLRNALLSSAHLDKNFMSLGDFLDKFFDNSEVEK